MLRYINYINDITSYSTNNNLLVLCDNNRNLKISKDIKEINIDGTSVQFFDNYIAFSSSYEIKTFFLNTDNDKKLVVTQSFFLETYYLGDILFYEYDFTDNSRKLGLYDINNNKIKKEFSEVFSMWDLLRIKDTIFYFDATKSNIKAFSLSNEHHLWEYSVVAIGEYNDDKGLQAGTVNKILGVFGEVLVVVITGGGNKLRGGEQLIGLHIQTGELLWLLNDFEYEGTYHNSLPTIATLQADKNHQYLIGFQGGRFIEIDPKDGKVLRYKNGITQYGAYTLTKPMDSFSLQGDYLYFRTVIAGIGGWPTAIGAFNYKTEQIEWLHMFEEFKKQGRFLPIGQPKVDGNRVYALDSVGTLHIFEKEETQ